MKTERVVIAIFIMVSALFTTIVVVAQTPEPTPTPFPTNEPLPTQPIWTLTPEGTPLLPCPSEPFTTTNINPDWAAMCSHCMPMTPTPTSVNPIPTIPLPDPGQTGTPPTPVPSSSGTPTVTVTPSPTVTNTPSPSPTPGYILVDSGATIQVNDDLCDARTQFGQFFSAINPAEFRAVVVSYGLLEGIGQANVGYDFGSSDINATSGSSSTQTRCLHRGGWNSACVDNFPGMPTTQLTSAQDFLQGQSMEVAAWAQENCNQPSTTFRMNVTLVTFIYFGSPLPTPTSTPGTQTPTPTSTPGSCEVPLYGDGEPVVDFGPPVVDPFTECYTLWPAIQIELPDVGSFTTDIDMQNIDVCVIYVNLGVIEIMGVELPIGIFLIVPAIFLFRRIMEW